MLYGILEKKWSKKMPYIELKDGRVKYRIYQFDKTAPENKIEISGNQAKPVGQYGYYQRQDRIIHFSGFGSRDKNGNAINGRIGSNQGEKSLEEGQVAAEGACLNFINNLATACDGRLDGVQKVIIRVDVNCDKDFKALPRVADGASRLLLKVFGKQVGTPIRTAAGCSSLPNDMTVEITATVHITKELAAKLDVRDAKQLAKILKMIFQLTNTTTDSTDTKLNYLLQSNKLTKFHRDTLEQCANKTLAQLLDLSEEGFNKILNGIKNDKFFDDIACKKDLVDLLISKAQDLDLIIKPARKDYFIVRDLVLAKQVEAKL